MYGFVFSPTRSEAKLGFELFTGKGGCAGCHLVGEPYALFTDHGLHDTGIGYRDPRETRGGRPRMQIAPGEFVELHPDAGALPVPGADLGRYEISGDPADRWKFKTPILRNVALTAPYMHDGSLPSLAAVVDYYDGGGRPHDGLDAQKRQNLLLDYGADGEAIELEVRRALIVYVLQRLSVDTTPDHSLNPQAYQLMLLNRDEIEPFAGWAFR